MNAWPSFITVSPAGGTGAANSRPGHPARLPHSTLGLKQMEHLGGALGYCAFGAAAAPVVASPSSPSVASSPARARLRPFLHGAAPSGVRWFCGLCPVVLSAPRALRSRFATTLRFLAGAVPSFSSFLLAQCRQDERPV